MKKDRSPGSRQSLKLSRETLRQLISPELVEVKGGYPSAPSQCAVGTTAVCCATD